MKYFVTGATGFVGNVVVRQLLSYGHQINAFVRKPERAAELQKLGAQIFQGDVTDKKIHARTNARNGRHLSHRRLV